MGLGGREREEWGREKSEGGREGEREGWRVGRDAKAVTSRETEEGFQNI